MRRLRRQAGLSLVEVTIMLLVLMLLTSVLAPSIFDYVKDAQWVKVKEDCEAIGVSVARMMRDVPSCFRLNGAGGCTVGNRVDLLYSDGTASGVILPGSQAATPYTLAGANAASVGTWDTTLVANIGSMESHFTRNNMPGGSYPTPSILFPATFPVGPLFGLGWRGGYLSAPIGPDPWGNAYMVNTMFLTTALDAISGFPVEGANATIWDRDVFCISSGPDRRFETYFGGCISTTFFGTCRQGDDWTFIIQGSTR
jgi:hypothetical protein